MDVSLVTEIVTVVLIVLVAVNQTIRLHKSQEDVRNRERCFNLLVNTYLEPQGYDVHVSKNWKLIKVGIPKPKESVSEPTNH
jgi:hypothetical protein